MVAKPGCRGCGGIAIPHQASRHEPRRHALFPECSVRHADLEIVQDLQREEGMSVAKRTPHAAQLERFLVQGSAPTSRIRGFPGRRTRILSARSFMESRRRPASTGSAAMARSPFPH